MLISLQSLEKTEIEILDPKSLWYFGKRPP